MLSDEESNGGYSSTSSEEEAIDIHFLAREGSIQDIDWALFKDRNRLLNLKEMKTGYSCLHCACEEGRIDVVAHLIKKGAIVDYRDLKFRTPLMIASTKGLTGTPKPLLRKESVCYKLIRFNVERLNAKRQERTEERS